MTIRGWRRRQSQSWVSRPRAGVVWCVCARPGIRRPLTVSPTPSAGIPEHWRRRCPPLSRPRAAPPQRAPAPAQSCMSLDQACARVSIGNPPIRARSRPPPGRSPQAGTRCAGAEAEGRSPRTRVVHVWRAADDELHCDGRKRNGAWGARSSVFPYSTCCACVSAWQCFRGV